MARARRFRVFAVEDDAVQLAWGDLGPGRHEVAVGDVGTEVDGGAGTFTASGLAAGTTYDVRLDGRRVGRATTLVPPPGRLLTKIATVNDCHVGEEGFGVRGRMREGRGVEPHARRCLRAALLAAKAWGAQLVVVKGDLTHRAWPWESAFAVEVLAGLDLPVLVTPGNHEKKRGAPPWAPPLRAAGFNVVDGPEPVAVDVPGLRIVAADTAKVGRHEGTLPAERARAVVDLAVAGGRPTLVALHHQLEPWPVPTCYPPGVHHREANAFLDDLGARHPASWVATGHTHRFRSRRRGPVQLTEVGSTKDFPGAWAGYAVHEGGLRQVALHVTGDGTDAWLDRTRRTAGGAWGLWSPGRLRDRCLVAEWPA